MKLGYQTNCWGGVVGHPGGVTSVKDSFYLANGSTREALEDIGDVGYQGYEIFDGNLMEYENKKDELLQLMEDQSLKLIGGYTAGNFIYDEILDEELLKVEKIASFTSELGAEHLVIGGGAVRSSGINDNDYKKLGEALNQIIKIAEKYNLIASYHPHLGSIVETNKQTAELIKYTDINLCPDTAHLQAAGSSPVEFIKTFKDRIKYVHLKDFNAGEFLPLGEGSQDLKGVLKALEDINYDGWITVELDSYDNPKEGSQLSKDYLMKNLYKETSV